MNRPRTYEILRYVVLRALHKGRLFADRHVDEDHGAVRIAMFDLAVHQGASISIDMSVPDAVENVLGYLAALSARLLEAVRIVALAATRVAQ
jgi:hypothetical protein